MRFLGIKFFLLVIIWLFITIDGYAQKHRKDDCFHDRKGKHPHKRKPLGGFRNTISKFQMDSLMQYIDSGEEQRLIDFILSQPVFVRDQNEARKLTMMHYHLGRIYQHSGMLYLATENYLKSLAIAEKNNLIINMVEVSLHLSKINQNLSSKKNNDVILNYLKPHINAFQSLGKNNAVVGIIAETYLSSALICKELNKMELYNSYLDSAEYYFDKVIPDERFPPFLGDMEVKMERGKYKEVLPVLLKQLKSFKRREASVKERMTMNIIRCYLHLEDFNSVNIFKRELYKLLNGPFIPAKIEASLLISEIYHKTALPDSAFHYLKQAYDLRNFMENERMVKLTDELNIKYQSAKKDLKLEAQKHELGRQNKTILFLIISTVIIVFVLILIYRNFLLKKRSNLLLKYKNQMIVEQSRQLEKLTNYKESLTSMIVHDLKNPINSIIGLSTDFLSNSNMYVIHNSGKKMLSLVLNILDVQKFEEAQFELKCANCSLNELIQSAISETTYLGKEKNIEINFVSSFNYFVSLDFDIIQRVLINILTNAIKYSDFNKRVKINLALHNHNSVVVSISDEGIGIPEKQLPYVFDKFWQYRSKKSGGVRSVGLGLTFCKMAIEAHDGHIEVSSKEGKGSIFSIYLPNLINYQEVQTLKLKLKRKDPIFDIRQYTFLEKYIERLQHFNAYEITDILGVLNEINSEDIQIIKWKDELERVVISGNTKQFKIILDRLLDLSKHQQ